MRRERNRVGGSKGIVEYEWAPDGKSILAPVDGDLYLADVATGVDPPPDEHAGDRDRRARLRRRALRQLRPRPEPLFAIDLATGAERPLTTEGKGTVTCGTAEFVAQEEMDRHTGTWWAPGDGRVAVECYDESEGRDRHARRDRRERDQGLRPALSRRRHCRT